MKSLETVENKKNKKIKNKRIVILNYISTIEQNFCFTEFLLTNIRFYSMPNYQILGLGKLASDKLNVRICYLCSLTCIVIHITEAKMSP